MNVFEHLKNDHKYVSRHLGKLAQTSEAAVRTRTDIFLRVKKRLEIHGVLTEEILYPILNADKQTRTLAQQAMKDHKKLMKLLTELAKIPRHAPEWGQQVTLLRMSFQKHVEIEDKSIFPKAREVLTLEQLADLSTRLEEEVNDITEAELKRSIY